jgi:hypothetical protein
MPRAPLAIASSQRSHQTRLAAQRPVQIAAMAIPSGLGCPMPWRSQTQWVYINPELYRLMTISQYGSHYCCIHMLSNNKNLIKHRKNRYALQYGYIQFLMIDGSISHYLLTKIYHENIWDLVSWSWTQLWPWDIWHTWDLSAISTGATFELKENPEVCKPAILGYLGFQGFDS